MTLSTCRRSYCFTTGTERTHSFNLNQGYVHNAGWPCAQTPSQINIGQSQLRRQWLTDNGRLEICQVKQSQRYDLHRRWTLHAGPEHPATSES